MLYILEGCDGSGKTTVANQLSKLLDAEIIHCSQYTPNDFYFFHDVAMAAREKNIIADRFCYGQFVYQTEEDRPLGRRSGNDNALNTLHELETKMLLYGVKIVYVTAPADVIKERLSLRGEHLINGLTVEEVQARYNAIRKMSILPWVDWNTGGTENV